MMVDLKVMAYFKISLSTRNWDRAYFYGGSWGEVGECLMSQTENSPQCCLVLACIIRVNHKQMSLSSNCKVGLVQNSLAIILVPKNHPDGTKKGSLYKENSAQG
ncbi:hypothetical protein C2U29_19875 [Aeromonas veronii]|nr:hypothetical protein C0073_014350 [Aeromonas veronii]PNW65779.1 hypothetical protein C2U29_19875 [Aeromonas veronii]TNH70805.1 hypothetical protein CF105_12645 [Aeromonas veronii]